MKKKTGRPTIYTEELATKICARIADGESLRKICDDPEMPARRAVHVWLLDKDKEAFVHQYETACNVRAENMFDNLVDIADKGEDVRRDRLRVDTRKWYLSKVLPKKFGDKLDVTSAGEKIESNVIDIKHYGESDTASQ